MSTSLHVTTVTRFGASTEIIVFQLFTDAVKAKSELIETYRSITEVAVVITLLEGTA